MTQDSTAAPMFRRCSIYDMGEVVKDLTDVGKQDITRAGVNPVLSPFIDYKSSTCDVVGRLGEAPLAVIGITPRNELWMHMTKEAMKLPKQFLKAARAWGVANLTNQKQMFSAAVDIQNTALLKMLRHWHFKVVRIFPAPPNNVYYAEMVFICPYPEDYFKTD